MTRGQQLDSNHFAVEIFNDQPLSQATMFYQHRQIPFSVRRNCSKFTFTGREWNEMDRRFAEVEVIFREAK